MTKVTKLHHVWLKNPDYKEVYESMQIEFEMERQRLGSTSAANESKRPIQFQDSQIQTRCSSDPD